MSTGYDAGTNAAVVGAVILNVKGDTLGIFVKKDIGESKCGLLQRFFLAKVNGMRKHDSQAQTGCSLRGRECSIDSEPSGEPVCRRLIEHRIALFWKQTHAHRRKLDMYVRIERPVDTRAVCGK